MRPAHCGSAFKMSFDRSVRLLKKELRSLEASVVVIATAHAERDISGVTGFPRADRGPAHPGVMVAADTKYGSLKWFTDHFRTWTANLHAIALTLERLRLADLYGVTKRGEQYSGWKMLPGPITAGNAAKTMNMEEAACFVAEQCRITFFDTSAHAVLTSKKAWQDAYKWAAKKLHPDANKDSPMWGTLQEAATLLNSLHNRK